MDTNESILSNILRKIHRVASQNFFNRKKFEIIYQNLLKYEK